MEELVAIINLSDLKPSDPLAANLYSITVLAKHDATQRVQVLVEAASSVGIARFRQDFPGAGVVLGDGTPDNHNEWRMLAFPNAIQGSTSPVEIFKRGKEKARMEFERRHGRPQG